nr:MarR family transcriptional regulator [Nocardioides lijunqiniae]
MPARVFAFLVADDRPTNTASELASGLGVSPAAISGAVRYLCDTHLVVRERNPTGRGDIFRIRDEDVWATIQTTRLLVIDLVIESVQEAITLLPRGSAGRGRVEDARDYFRFVQEDAHGLDMRWREWRDAHRS